MAELTAIFESRPILMKHKSLLVEPGAQNYHDTNGCSSFYRPSAHALAQVVVDVPQVFVQVFIFLIIVYL